MKRSMVVLVVLLATAGICSLAMAQHYPLGSEGLKGATLPPPGLYLRNYVNYYRATVLRDSGGDNSGTGANIDVFAFVPRLIWMTDQKILGADYGMDVALPLIYKDVELNAIPAPGFKGNDFCMGDILVEPIDLAWHGDRYDIGAAFGVWMPTGKYDDSPLGPRLASPGLNYWTTMFTFGGTYYFDAEKTWHASGLNRYEINTTDHDIDVGEGQHWTLEWGFGKTFNKVLDIGIVGYQQWQMTDGFGSGVGPGIPDRDTHDRAAAVGPEVSLMIPQIMTIISTRVNFEYSCVDRPEGINTMMTVTKIF